MSDPIHDAGMAVRREVLGDEHVDRAVAGTTPFTADFQDYITRCAWGSVWTRDGLVCSAGAFKDHVKLNFFSGASLKDPKGMFNAGLDAKNTRAIDFREGDSIDASALKDLIRAAVAHNLSAGKKR